MKKWKLLCCMCVVYFQLTGDAYASINVAALLPVELQFQAVLDEMRKQFGPNYHIDVIDMKKPITVEAIAVRCKANDVRALILMDTKAVKTTMELEKFDSTFKALPKFVFMTLMVESTARGLSNICGIKFEVPIYTVITNFRIISQKDFSRVGVFYRKSFSSYVEEARKLLGKEQISLSAVCVDCGENGPAEALKIMNASLDRLVKQDKVELFFIPADNLIVNSQTLKKFWIKKVKRMKLPALAPFDILTSSKFGVTVFSADPDLPQLGVQAANQIVDHFENKTPLNEIGFEPTISIKSTLNSRVAADLYWKLRDDKLGRITTIVK